MVFIMKKVQLIALSMIASMLVAFINIRPMEKPEAAANQELLEAAENGDQKRVLEALNNGADINNTDAPCSGWTPLHLAAYNGHEGVVRLLIDRGANINIRNVDGLTPLHAVVETGHEEIARLLIDRGANINTVNNFGTTPLHKAAQSYDTAMVQLLLDNGSDINAAHGFLFKGKSIYKDTPLFTVCDASSICNTAMAKLLIRNGATATQNQINQALTHPLHRAAALGNIQEVTTLLQKAQTPDNFREALAYAAGRGHTNIVLLLLKHCPLESVFEAQRIVLSVLRRLEKNLEAKKKDDVIEAEIAKYKAIQALLLEPSESLRASEVSYFRLLPKEMMPLIFQFL